MKRWAVVVGGFVAGFAGVTLAAGQWLAVAPLLPAGEGRRMCFAGDFDRGTAHVRDWSRATQRPTGRWTPDGQEILRNVPADVGTRPVRRLVLGVSDNGREGNLDFLLAAHVEIDGKTRELKAAGDCPWGRSPVAALGGAWLGCGIDCDGGSLDLDRVAFRGALRLGFDRTYPLRMSLGCGGGGRMTLGADAGDAGFVLEPVPIEVCFKVFAPPDEE